MVSCELIAGSGAVRRALAALCFAADVERPWSRDALDDHRHSQYPPPTTITIMPASTYQKALLCWLLVVEGDALTGALGAGSPPLCASRGANPSPATENLTCSCAGASLM